MGASIESPLACCSQAVFRCAVWMPHTEHQRPSSHLEGLQTLSGCLNG